MVIVSSSLCRLTVHRLAARTLIRSLEMEDEEEQDEGVKKKVVELSVQSGVSSVFTAFIAVNKGDGEAIQGPLVRRHVPTASECFQGKYQTKVTFLLKRCSGYTVSKMGTFVLRS